MNRYFESKEIIREQAITWQQFLPQKIIVMQICNYGASILKKWAKDSAC